MNGEVPGILEVFTGNRKMILGVLALLLALVLAFSAIYRRRSTYSREGTVEPGKTVGIAKRKPENEGVLKLISAGGTEKRKFRVALLDDERRVIDEVDLVGSERSVEITDEVDYFKPIAGGSFDYKYEIRFSYQPFRLLAVPAGILTLLGVVAVYRGFEQYMADFAEARVGETEGTETKEEERPDIDFMGTGSEESEGNDRK